jgi:hypothetical protein
MKEAVVRGCGESLQERLRIEAERFNGADRRARTGTWAASVQ